MSTGHTHDDHDHDHGHEHPAAPMVERNNGLRDSGDRRAGAGDRARPFYRRGSPQVHRMGRVRRTHQRLAIGGEGLDRPGFQGAGSSRTASRPARRGSVLDWAEPTGFGTPSDYTNFVVLEDTPTLHHVIVCTLCSCYPRPILGMSPEWYRTTNYRRRLVRWPREVLAEFGLIASARGGDKGRGLRTRSAASWSFRSGLKAPRTGRRSNSRRS